MRVLNEFTDLFIFISSANNDPDGHLMNKEIQKFVSDNKSRVLYKASFGQKLYHQCLFHSDILIGNSSSGIIEAPMLNTMTINIGTRQTGREFDKSIITVPNVIDQIRNAVKTSLKLEEFERRKSKSDKLTSVADKIIEQLISFENKNESFYDLDR